MCSFRLLCVLVASVLAWPISTCAAAAPTPASEALRMHRGQQVRTDLLDALEDAYQHGGAWPQRLPEPAEHDLHLLYTPADKSVSAEHLLAAVTVVLHEPIEHSDGAWVGYADGHLELAPDAAALAACMDQQETARRAIQTRDRLRQSFSAAATQPAEPSHGTLTIKVIDPDGRPVAGAAVGQYCELDDSRPDEPHTAFHPPNGKSVQLKTDAQGQVTVDAAAVFVNKFARQAVAPLWILDDERGLGALEDFERFEFGGSTVHEIRIQPLCRVSGQVSSVGLWEIGRQIKRTFLYASKPGQQLTGTFECVFNGPHFELSLPPGQFMLNVYGTENGRDLPFVVALDGGGKARIVHSAGAEYGIQSFPTTLLIGRDGTLLCDFESRAKDAAAQIQSVVTTGKLPPGSD